MLRTCVAAAKVDGSVCVMLEPIALYHTGDLHDEGDEAWLAASGTEHVPLGAAYTHRGGRDLTLVTWGNGLYLSLRVARRLRERGIGASVVDLRWLAPLPLEEVLREATATATLVVDDPTHWRRGGIVVSVDAGYVGSPGVRAGLVRRSGTQPGSPALGTIEPPSGSRASVRSRRAVPGRGRPRAQPRRRPMYAIDTARLANADTMRSRARGEPSADAIRKRRAAEHAHRRLGGSGQARQRQIVSGSALVLLDRGAPAGFRRQAWRSHSSRAGSRPRCETRSPPTSRPGVVEHDHLLRGIPPAVASPSAAH
jgi:hypothetical protein